MHPVSWADIEDLVGAFEAGFEIEAVVRDRHQIRRDIGVVAAEGDLLFNDALADRRSIGAFKRFEIGFKFGSNRLVVVFRDATARLAVFEVEIKATGNQRVGPCFVGNVAEFAVVVVFVGEPALLLQPGVSVDLVVEAGKAVIRGDDERDVFRK